MRLTASSRTSRVDIRLDGSSPGLLRQAERTARRLLAHLDAPAAPEAPEPPEQPFGYSISAQIEQSGPAPQREHDADPTLQGGTHESRFHHHPTRTSG